MKIKTQFYLLIAGIIVVPVLLILAQVIYQYSSREQERRELADFRTIAAMFNEEVSVNNRELFSNFLFRLSKLNKTAVFRKDLQVIHSTIPEFEAGTFATMEEIFALLDRQNSRYSYAFGTLDLLKNHGYVLIQREQSPPDGAHFGPRLNPLFIAAGLFLIVFVIAMSLFIARSITKSIIVLENATKRIAAGELDLTVSIKGSNEITSLTNSLNIMRGNLKEEEQRRYRFIMGVTHDLKTPLAIIKAYTEAIEDGITEYPDANTSPTEIINAKLDQLDGRINDLIEFVRMDTGEWRSRLNNIHISTFLEQSVRALMPDVELLSHELRFNSALPDDLVLPMDERLVQRALENIVNNAIRYSPAGSVISLNARATDNVILVTINDNGLGIDEIDLPHIFEMFYRGSSSRREQGMGLGLAVVKWVTDCHGWGISATSEKGQGTCFTITIPVFT